MNRRLLALGAALLLVASGCSDDPAPTAGGGDATPPNAAESQPAEHKGHNKKVRAKGKGGGRSGNEGTRSENDGADGDGGESGGGGPSDGSGSDSAGRSTVPYPAAGTYVYAQEGFEEFCQTTSCEWEDLPAQQPIETTYKSRSASQAVVVSEARASANRVARTTFRFTPERALITDVYTRFDYQNVRFEDSYHPDPPVEALRFPVQSGQGWSGRWKDKTSGSYDISVGPREQVQTPAGTVEAFRIETDVTFDGQFEGSSSVVVWFDPSTKTIVRSKGSMDVRSAFGRYRTEFTTTLRSGPGY